MTRIIAGFAGSLRLDVPRSGTRPTSDRVREAIFSALDARDRLHEARVIDLYAGSGALGLEAASRGAATVTLVERARAAVQTCRRNVEALLRVAPQPLTITVSAQSVQTFLEHPGPVYDIAFVDPPYELGESELAHTLDLLTPRLAPEAVVVVERSSRAPEPTWPDTYRRDRRKDYGETTLWWATLAGEHEDTDALAEDQIARDA